MYCKYEYFCTTGNKRNARKIDILISKCCHFLNFRNFALSVVHTIAIFILIKVHFGFLTSNKWTGITSARF